MSDASNDIYQIITLRSLGNLKFECSQEVGSGLVTRLGVRTDSTTDCQPLSPLSVFQKTARARPTLLCTWLSEYRSRSLLSTKSFQLFSSMNALQDPTKKPSINSLLNPQESSAHPVGTGHGQNQSNQSSSMFQYGSVPSYNLRAASWDPDDDPHKRRPLNGTHNVHRQYQQHPTLPPTPSSHNFVDLHASRLMIRPRIDESPMYPSEGQAWQTKHPQQYQQQHQQHQHAVSGMPYPSAMYSDERTGILVSQCHLTPCSILIIYL